MAKAELYRIEEHCPDCNSTDVKETLDLQIPKEIHDKLMEWTEFVCNDCGATFISGKLLISGRTKGK